MKKIYQGLKKEIFPFYLFYNHRFEAFIKVLLFFYCKNNFSIIRMIFQSKLHEAVIQRQQLDCASLKV